MVNDISIVAGDPFKTKGGASFTCFVLPFRFDPVALSFYDARDINQQDQPRYTPVDMRSKEWIKRQRYFTSETARVLYKHARWFELSESHWEKFQYPQSFEFYVKKQRKITVRLHPPRLALFEWHEQKDSDLFHTGFLVVEASFVADENTQQPRFSDLLHFNELFRYWRIPFKEHKAVMKKAMGRDFSQESEELYFQRWVRLLRIPLQPSSDEKLYYLFSEKWDCLARAWWLKETYDQVPVGHDNPKQENTGWICHADDRCFVWSCVVVEQGTKALASMGNNDCESVTKLGSWIKLLNVDGPGSDISEINDATPFEKEWVKDRSYERWLHYNTLYGFNYHAGVMLTGPSGDPPITRHFHDQYFDMTLLLLYLRVTLFRFSNELTHLSVGMRNNTLSFREQREAFKALRREFAVFTNLYQFPLISNQQQAIEMYTLIRSRMDVQDLFREVEEEIKSSHEYFQFEEESRLNINIYWLTRVGIPIAIIGTLATILSIKEVMGYLKSLFQ